MNYLYTDDSISQAPAKVVPKNTETHGVLAIMRDCLDRYQWD